MIGQLLGGRYELVERIGGGGMALVYQGLDRLLNRKVAVKVLRQQYVHDEEFIRRFRREAQAAASLSHPNVVSIYDVGQEDETHFIVMEYIEGKTLNDLIKERAPLPVEEAVRIAGQICDALDHAHANRIIHRDIKPHNILIGKNGRVKVTDFGIARAANASQITQTGSVVGSVHYFSPEHAKGTLTGAQSDLYSLGIVLYQMLTGRLPFLGESPISVALKHLQEDVEEPRNVNPLIPQSVENIILKSMRKSPDERYQSAKDMLDDLETCLTPERRNEPKITFASDEYDDNEKTRVIPVIRGDQYAQPLAGEPGDEPGGRPGRRRWVKPLVWTIVTLLVLTMMALAVRYVKNMLVVPETDVPNVVGMTVEEARKLINDKGLLVEVVEEPNAEVEKDRVIRQDPGPMRLKIDNTVTIYVSTGPPLQKMPEWIGKKAADVLKTELVALGVDPSQVKQTEQFSDKEKGVIIEQQPAPGEEFDPKTVTIQLTVSKGRETIAMPNLIGSTEAEAQAIAQKFDLKLIVDKRPTFRQPANKVFDQFPYKENDPVTPGAEVTIYVSTGYPETARETVVSLEIAPATPGKESTIEIRYSDATGDNISWGTRKIKEPQTFDVKLVLSPDKDGTVEYFRDGNRIDIRTRTYEEVAGTGPKKDNGGKQQNPPQGGGGNRSTSSSSGNAGGAAQTMSGATGTSTTTTGGH